jgi:hypothetical protein
MMMQKFVAFAEKLGDFILAMSCDLQPPTSSPKELRKQIYFLHTIDYSR